MDYSIDFFSRELSTRLRNFNEFFRDQDMKINSQLSGTFIEATVRAFVKDHIGIRRIVHGTIYNQVKSNISQILEFDDSPKEEYHLQIDGIIYNPTKCVPAVSLGDFAILNAAQCEGVVEIKSSCTNDVAFFNRLYSIHSKCSNRLEASKLFGVVIKTKSSDETIVSLQKQYHDISIFYLFTEDSKGNLTQRDCDTSRFFEAVFGLNSD